MLWAGLAAAAAVILVVVLVVALGGGGDGDGDGDGGGGGAETGAPLDGYTDAVRNNFVDACASTGGDRPTCECAFDHIAATVPFADFTHLEDQQRGGEGLDAEAQETLTQMTDIASECQSGA
jgi:hypothetical protein